MTDPGAVRRLLIGISGSRFVGRTWRVHRSVVNDRRFWVEDMVWIKRSLLPLPRVKLRSKHVPRRSPLAN